MESQLLAYLREFIAFQTIAGNAEAKRQCLAWIRGSFMGSLPHEIFHGEVEHAPYALLAHPEPRLLLFAHIDVVPGEESQFSLELQGGKAHGRGVKDMKGAVLPYLMAYRDACQAGREPPLSILLTSDEEVGGRSIPALIKEGVLRTPIAYTPDTGDNPAIVVEHKGSVWATLTASGRGSHGAWPWDGQNPIYLLTEALSALAKTFPAGTKEDWQMTVAPTELKGSDAKNKVPDQAECILDIRYPPEICSSAEDALGLLRKHLPSGCSLMTRVAASPLATDPNHPMVQLLKRVSEEVLQKPVAIGREHGASDARFFQEFGIPAFLYGPEGGGLHSRTEWVSVQSLLDHYQIARKLYEELRS